MATIISFQPLKQKVFCSKNNKSLLVLEAICENGSVNRIRPGNKALIHVRQSSFVKCVAVDIEGLAVLLADEKQLSIDHFKKGCWVDADSTKQLVVKADVNIERNRRGDRLIECIEILAVLKQDDDRYLPTNNDDEYKSFIMHDEDFTIYNPIRLKNERHIIFAHWVVDTYGKEYLTRASSTGVLDVAGGNGKISHELSKLGIQATLLDPNPRCYSEKRSKAEFVDRRHDELPFGVIPHPLNGDGSDLLSREDNIGHTIKNCSLICGLHPDQATEPIVALALRLNVPFAVV